MKRKRRIPRPAAEPLTRERKSNAARSNAQTLDLVKLALKNKTKIEYDRSLVVRRKRDIRSAQRSGFFILSDLAEITHVREDADALKGFPQAHLVREDTWMEITNAKMTGRTCVQAKVERK